MKVDSVDKIISFFLSMNEYNQEEFNHLVDRRERLKSLIESIKDINSTEKSRKIYEEWYGMDSLKSYDELKKKLEDVEIEIKNFMK